MIVTCEKGITVAVSATLSASPKACYDIIADYRVGHPTITRGQTFRVRGEFSVTVARKVVTPMRLLLTLKAATH